MNKSEVYKNICEWENEIGESFVDNFDSEIHPLTYMTWCLGRGYLSSEKYDMWSVAYQNGILEACDANYFIYSEKSSELPLFAVVVSDEWNEAEQEVAYRILAEFISEIRVYTIRFKDFLKANKL